MKLGVFTVVLSNFSLEDAIKTLKAKGVEAIELGCGGYPGSTHCNSLELLSDDVKLTELKELVKKYDMVISALSVHGNGVHPDEKIAEDFTNDFKNAVQLAQKLEVDTVITFSGCPGGAKGDKSPNWVTCPWPPDFLDTLEYQWNEVLIPYWKEMTAYAKSYGIKKIALEMHPGFCVYNTQSMLKLREAVGPEIGCNFDPSHLFWQGINPVSSLRALGECVFHFHAKDTKIDEINTEFTGVLDTKHYDDELNRSWVFRSVGYGHSYQVWKDMMSTLRMIGYDGVISIEHEDSLMSGNEGLTKAISFLKEVMMFEEVGEMFWA